MVDICDVIIRGLADELGLVCVHQHNNFYKWRWYTRYGRKLKNTNRKSAIVVISDGVLIIYDASEFGIIARNDPQDPKNTILVECDLSFPGLIEFVRQKLNLRHGAAHYKMLELLRKKLKRNEN